MPKPSVDESVSLFPFLSILACVIGILVLMITAIALGQIGRDSPSAATDAAAAQQAAQEAQLRVAQYRAARQSIQADRELLAVLRKEGEQQAGLRARVEELRRQVAARESESQVSADARHRLQAELAQQQAALERLNQTIADIERQLQPLREQQTKLLAELAKRQAPPEEPEILVQPSGSGADLKPTFVECAGASVVLHDGPQPLRIPAAQLSGHAQFLQLLQKVKQTDKGSVIFLVRPDGVGTYQTARHVARSNYVTNGKLAIGGQGKLDLSRYGKKP